VITFLAVQGVLFVNDLAVLAEGLMALDYSGGIADSIRRFTK
jgi:hypothetical protein